MKSIQMLVLVVLVLFVDTRYTRSIRLRELQQNIESSPKTMATPWMPEATPWMPNNINVNAIYKNLLIKSMSRSLSSTSETRNKVISDEKATPWP